MAYLKTYRFGATSFKNYVWLNDENSFQNPKTLEVEMVTSGAYRVDIFAPNGTLVAASQPRANLHGGWEFFDFGGGGGEFIPPIGDGHFKLRLFNLGSGTREARQGVLSMRLPGHPWEAWLPAIANYVRQILH